MEPLYSLIHMKITNCKLLSIKIKIAEEVATLRREYAAMKQNDLYDVTFKILFPVRSMNGCEINYVCTWD
jgi:hypothetical protein